VIPPTANITSMSSPLFARPLDKGQASP
jgi:hypothetical protein